jgi:excisionase family DNA binding protein
MDKLLTVCQAAEYLQLHTQTLYKKREIPRARIGRSIRFKKSDLEKYVEQNTISPSPFHPPVLNNQSFSLRIPSEHGMDYFGGKNGMAKAKSQSRLNIGIGAVYPRKFKFSLTNRVKLYISFDNYRQVKPMLLKEICYGIINKN